VNSKRLIKVATAIAACSGLVGFVIGSISNLPAIGAQKSAAYAAASKPGNFREQSICGPAFKSVCTVGSIGPGGGTIFFVDWHNEYPEFDYLETAPNDWSADRSTIDPVLPWCDNAIKLTQGNINNWIDRAPGKGKSNTQAMLKVCQSGAANAVDEYNKSGRSKFHDWFLPSLGCLMWMANATQGLAGLSSTEYWSSSEYSNDGAWVESVSRGYQGSAGKANLLAVRPARSF
jgi:hypothetical protein